MKRSIASLAILTFAILTPPAHASVTVDAGTIPRRCISADGVVSNYHASMYACFDYGPSAHATASPSTSLTVTYVSGFMSVQTSKGRDSRSFGFDPTNPSNPQPTALASFVMDPSMSTATFTLQVQTISASLTFTADTNVPGAFETVGATQSVDGTPYMCAGQGALIEADRSGSVTGTMTSSLKGGGTFKHGYGDVSQGFDEYSGASNNPYGCF